MLTNKVGVKTGPMMHRMVGSSAMVVRWSLGSRLVLILAWVALVGATACGELKTRDQPVVQLPTSALEKSELQQVYEAFQKAVTDPRFRDLQVDIDLPEGTIELGAISRKLEKRAPVLAWIPCKGSVDLPTLEDQIQHTYPEARPSVISAMAQAFFRFDLPAYQGNGDGHLDRDEAMLPGIVLGGIVSNKRLRSHADPKDRLWAEAIRIKVEKRKLSLMDAKLTPLEWSSLEEQLEEARLALGYTLLTRGSAKHTIDQPFWGGYDQKVQGGNGNGKLDDLEAFNALTDLQFADAVKRRPMSSRLISYLRGVYPKVGANLFGILSPNPFFWREGRADRKDVYRLADAFNRVQWVEFLFKKYDLNANTLLDQAEFSQFLHDAGFNDPKGVWAWVVGISDHVPDWTRDLLFEEIDLFHPNHALQPYELYERLEKLEGQK